MLLPCGVKLNATPLKPSELPPEDKVIQAGRELIEATLNWKSNGSFAKGVVTGYVHPKDADDDQPWFCRVSEHSAEEASFDEFWFGLGTNKPEHEKKFVHVVDDVVQLKKISDTVAIWSIHYHFAPPISNRAFTVAQFIQLDLTSTKRTGFVVSIPVDVHTDAGDAELAKSDFKGVRGRYVSIERVQERDDGKVEWRMATSSTPGGNIPNFIVQKSTPGQVANDVPMFLKWLHSERDYFKRGIEGSDEQSEAPPMEAEQPLQ